MASSPNDALEFAAVEAAGSSTAPQFALIYWIGSLALLGSVWGAGKGWTWDSIAATAPSCTSAVATAGLFALAGIPPFASFHVKLGVLSTLISGNSASGLLVFFGVAGGWIAYVSAAYGLVSGWAGKKTTTKPGKINLLLPQVAAIIFLCVGASDLVVLSGAA